MNKQDRCVYIKNGDVVAQLQRIVATGGSKITSGPDAFIYDFLSKNKGMSVFVASRSHRNARYENNTVAARTYSTSGNRILKLLRRVYATTDLLIRILFYKPTKIICGTKGSFLWIAHFISGFYSIPIVYSCHNRVVDQNNGVIKKFSMMIDNWCIRRCTNVICHGPYLRDQLVAIGIPKIKVLVFDVSFSDFFKNCANMSDHCRLKSRKTILYVGRIEKEKGVIDLLEAYAEALPQIPDARMVYIGSGSASSELQAEVKRLKLTNKVQLLGYLNHDGIVDVMRCSALVVTPTRSAFPEGRCMSAMEALILGVPVIAPNYGPFPYLIQHNVNGLLFDADSVADLREKLLTLLTNVKQYEKLKKGARFTSGRLMYPEMTFGEAVNRAFCREKKI